MALLFAVVMALFLARALNLREPFLPLSLVAVSRLHFPVVENPETGAGTGWSSSCLGGLWVLGASFFFYEPFAGMTDPPMQWGYPRTVEGFFHAISRGQYENANPTGPCPRSGPFHHATRHPGQGYRRRVQLGFGVHCAGPARCSSSRCKSAERSWIIGLIAIYLCIGGLLMVLMNTSPDRQSADLNKVFFITSHGIIVIMAGYGMALIASFMATHYGGFRRWGLLGGAVAALLGLYCLWDATGKHYFGLAGQVGFSGASALDRGRPLPRTKAACPSTPT